MAAKRGLPSRKVQIEVVEVKDDQVGMRRLLSGEVDSFDTTTGGIARDRAAPIRIRGLFLAGDPLCGAGGPGITKMEDLKGKPSPRRRRERRPDTVARASLAAFRCRSRT